MRWRKRKKKSQRKFCEMVCVCLYVWMHTNTTWFCDDDMRPLDWIGNIFIGYDYLIIIWSADGARWRHRRWQIFGLNNQAILFSKLPLWQVFSLSLLRLLRICATARSTRSTIYLIITHKRFVGPVIELFHLRTTSPYFFFGCCCCTSFISFLRTYHS